MGRKFDFSGLMDIPYAGPAPEEEQNPPLQKTHRKLDFSALEEISKKKEPQIKPIETEYNGYRFRSRLEARWAIFFDYLHIKYFYEPEGFELSDGTRYLPDFYLPELNTFFEVKGVMEEIDRHKIEQLIEDLGIPVVVGYGDMTFEGTIKWIWPNDESGNLERSYSFGGRYTYLFRCKKCGKLYFNDTCGGYECPHCHDNGFDNKGMDILDEHNEVFKTAIKKAKQARFEHGETPNKESNNEKY